MSGEAANFPTVFLILFPVFFIALWLGVTTLLASAGGWIRLEGLYPDRPEPTITSLRMQSGQLGSGHLLNPFGTVSYNGCLRYDICPGGLRISVWKIFGPFRRPFFVPWSEITARERSFLFFTVISLRLGQVSGISLTINQRTFARLTQIHPLPLAIA